MHNRIFLTLILSTLLLTIGCDGNNSPSHHIDSGTKSMHADSGEMEVATQENDAGMNIQNVVVDSGENDRNMQNADFDSGEAIDTDSGFDVIVDSGMNVEMDPLNRELTDVELAEFGMTLESLRDTRVEVSIGFESSCGAYIAHLDAQFEFCPEDEDHMRPAADSCAGFEGFDIIFQLTDCSNMYLTAAEDVLCVDNEWTEEPQSGLEECRFRGPDFAALNKEKCEEVKERMTAVFDQCAFTGDVGLECEYYDDNLFGLEDCREYLDAHGEVQCVENANGNGELVYPEIPEGCIQYSLTL